VSGTKLENDPVSIRNNSKKLPRIELRMLSFNLSERIVIADLLTEAGFSISNESAANLERFEQRVTDDDWGFIFIDARIEFESVSSITALARKHAGDVPLFAVIDDDQNNQAELMELGIADMFPPDDMQRMVGSLTRELFSQQ
jgi:hypothetical protein